jgi:hypothetical protein
MRVQLWACGPTANESEAKSFEHLKTRLLSLPGNDEWILLTNLTFSITHQLQSDEIDVVAIGPGGVQVIEIKHWSSQWIETHEEELSQQADRLTMKARKVGTTLRQIAPDLPRVDGALLLSQEPSKVARHNGRQVRGVRLHSLNDWKALLGVDAPAILTAAQVAAMARRLHPAGAGAADSALRRLAGYVNLELQTPAAQRFPRVYKGSHPQRRDRVELHLYDLSASDDRNAEAKARRAFEALHRLQLFHWAPRILDSYQEAPGYAGEMYLFTLVDPAAPTIEKRAEDTSWTAAHRLAFCARGGARCASAARGRNGRRTFHSPQPEPAHDPGQARQSAAAYRFRAQQDPGRSDRCLQSPAARTGAFVHSARSAGSRAPRGRAALRHLFTVRFAPGAVRGITR